MKKMGYANVQTVLSAEDDYTTDNKGGRNNENDMNQANQENDEDYLFHIYTLGKFEVYSKGYILTEDNKRSKRMWNLFKYILTNSYALLHPHPQSSWHLLSSRTACAAAKRA